MARKLDDIFNECYERIRSGESLESCLRSYPQHRPELEPLLRTTFDIGRRVSYIHPRPEFKHWAQVRFESAQRYPGQEVRAETPVASTWWRPAWAVAVTVVLVLILSTGSAMAASLQALPDQPLYPVKLMTEQARLALAISDTQKANVQTDLARIRAAEVEAMANEGKMEEAAKAAVMYDEQFEKAVAAIMKAEGTEPQPTAYVPPSEATPPSTATPPVVTPPSVTTTSENTTSTETTTPATTETQPPTTDEFPPTTTDELPPTTTDELPPTITDELPPTTTDELPPTITDELPPTTTEEPPAVIEEPPVVTQEPPPATTTQDKGKTSKSDKLRKSLDRSKDKSLQALKDAKEKAAQEKKRDWQKAIDTISKKKAARSQSTRDTMPQSDNVSANQ